jgi:hypothetical protein
LRRRADRLLFGFDLCGFTGGDVMTKRSSPDIVDRLENRAEMLAQTALNGRDTRLIKLIETAAQEIKTLRSLQPATARDPKLAALRPDLADGNAAATTQEKFARHDPFLKMYEDHVEKATAGDAAATRQEPTAWRITDGEGDYEYLTEESSEQSRAWSRRYGREWEPLYIGAAQPVAARAPPSADERWCLANNISYNDPTMAGGDAVAQPVAATPSSLQGMIAAIYGELDAEDCNWIDREWIKWRGKGTITYALTGGVAQGSKQLADLAEKIADKITQLEHYKEHDCQIDHAKTIAEGRLVQAQQIQHWIGEMALSIPLTEGKS